MKKFICILVSIMFIVIMFAGCGSDKSVSETSKASESTVPKAGSRVNIFGWEIPEETLEITYYAGQDNPDYLASHVKVINKYLLEEFNVKLNKIVYDIDMTERLNLMLASNDYPEVITGMSPQDAAVWVEQGKAIELTPYLDEHAPNIKKQLGDIYKRLLDKDGKLYVLPLYWGYLPIPDQSAHIRWDWWQQMGAPQFSTPDEYFDIIKRMHELHPTNVNGEKTYGLSAYDSWRSIYPVLMGIWGLKSGYKEDSNHNLTHWVNTSEGLEMTKYINRYYREGLLDPDCFINKYDDWKSKFSNERIIGHIGAWWVSWNAGHEIWQNTMPDWNDEMRYVQVKLKAPGVERAYFSPKDTTGLQRAIITDKCKDPTKVLKWLNFEITDMGTRLVGWGPPNLEQSVWTYDGKTWAWVESAKEAMVNSRFGEWEKEKGDPVGMNTHLIVASQGLMKDDGKSTMWFDQNFNDLAKWKKIMHDNLRDTVYDFSAFRSISLPPDDPITVVNQQIIDLLDTGWAAAVNSATEQECEQKFLELRKKLNDSGLGDLEKFYTTNYKKNLEAWK